MYLLFAVTKRRFILLTVSEIAEEQTKDKSLQQQNSTSNVEETLIENTYVLCKNDKIIIPKTLQTQAVAWYHHYLQHPGHTCLEETLRSAMYWKICFQMFDYMSKPVNPGRSTKRKS